ncbi:DUF3307 domain-containing protein [Streptococcus tangpeifui]|uniref:DUF3307 domain-containing protein n=1 Tax=Streptococcus tangpeifui TaxID=2709400 RepID=UPI0013EA6E5C|nr:MULTISPECIES: DUF3307 domain-containing protein [unclassified Streptococcus]
MLEILTFSDYLIENPLLTLTLLAHFLADFQWQSQRMADQKSYSIRVLSQHLIIVALPLLVCFVLNPAAGIYLLVVWLSHVVIDSAKFYFVPNMHSQSWQQVIFVGDQILHYLAIFSAYICFKPDTILLISQNSELIRLGLFLTLITKPINIVFKLFFSKYQVSEEPHEPTVAGAGALIGLLERLIMGIFLLFGQFAAIGLVFTAKSIARYDRISKNQAFAEYYLIGSLFSIISVLLVYGILLV